MLLTDSIIPLGVRLLTAFVPFTTEFITAVSVPRRTLYSRVYKNQHMVYSNY